MADTKRKKFSRKKKRNTKLVKIILLAVLALGLLALIAVLLQEKAPEPAMIKTYPMEYTDLIRANAAEQEIDPAYVAAIILAESSYNPNATSAVNAQGLMQIMPETGAWLAGKFGEAANYTPDRLFDVNTNLRYGCWYLGYLARTFGGDVVKMAAGYHAGQGRVAEWLKDPAISPDGRTLPVERIPYPDTKQYVERVVKTHAIYRKLYWEN